MNKLNTLIFALSLAAAAPALANQYRCILTDPADPSQKEIVFIEPSELESFLRLMRIQGIKANCTRVQEA